MNVRSVKVNVGFVSVGLEGETCWVEKHFEASKRSYDDGFIIAASTFSLVDVQTNGG